MADVAEMSEPQQPAQQSAAPAPEVDEAKKRRINNATVFLKNPRVQASPLSRRVNFLKGKGLTPEEISEAFSAAGTPQSVEEVKKIINTAPAPAATAPPPAAAPAATVQPAAGVASGLPAHVQPAALQPQQQAAQPVYPQQQHSQLPPIPPPLPLYQAPGMPLPPQPYPPQQPLPPHPHHGAHAATNNSGKWKDYFIGATVVAGALYATGKVAAAFLPYEVVRKGESRNNSPPPTADLAMPQPEALPEPPKEKENTELVEAKGQVTLLETKVQELETKLETERKEKAELNGLKGRQQGQILQLNRTNERTTAEVKRLTMELEAANKQIDELKSQSSAAAPASEPPVASAAAPAGSEEVEGKAAVEEVKETTTPTKAEEEKPTEEQKAEQ